MLCCTLSLQFSQFIQSSVHRLLDILLKDNQRERERKRWNRPVISTHVRKRLRFVSQQMGCQEQCCFSFTTCRMFTCSAHDYFVSACSGDQDARVHGTVYPTPAVLRCQAAFSRFLPSMLTYYSEFYLSLWLKDSFQFRLCNNFSRNR